MIDLQCPKCGAKLRAPDDAAGMHVRCKGCREKFRLPGAAVDGSLDSRQLSVIPPHTLPAPRPTTKPAVAQVLAEPIPLDDTFIEDSAPTRPLSEPETKPEKRPTAKPPAKPALPVSGDPFSFNDPGAIVVPSDPRRASSRKPGSGRKKSGGGPLFLVVGLLGGLVLAGGGFAVYWFVLKSPDVAKAPTPPTVDTPPADAKPEKPAAKPNDGRSRRAEPKQQIKGEQAAGRGAGESERQQKAKGDAGKSRLAAPPGADAKLIAPAKETIPLGCAADAIKDIRISTGKGDVASVFVLRRQFAGFQGVGATDVVERMSRNGGRPAGSFEVPADQVPPRRPFDVSDNSQRAVVEGPAGRLTVYDFEVKKKVWDAVDPFAGLPDRTGLTAAFFLTTDTLAVVDRTGAVDVWAVGEQKRRETGKVPGAKGAVCATRAGGKTLVAVGRQVFAFAGASTDDAPAAEFPPMNAEPVAITADVLGKRAAVMYKTANAGHTVAVLSLDGKKEPELVLAFADEWGWPEAIGWADQDTLTVVTRDRAAVMLNLERSCAVAYLKGPGSPFASEFGLHLTALPKDVNTSVLVGVELPLTGSRQLAAEAKESGGPLYLLPRADGLAR